MSELTDFRRSKDDFLTRDHHSPLTDEQQRSFSGLSYYDENSALSPNPPKEGVGLAS